MSPIIISSVLPEERAETRIWLELRWLTTKTKLVTI
jgi:hypothetical protein